MDSLCCDLMKLVLLLLKEVSGFIETITSKGQVPELDLRIIEKSEAVYSSNCAPIITARSLFYYGKKTILRQISMVDIFLCT